MVKALEKFWEEYDPYDDFSLTNVIARGSNPLKRVKRVLVDTRSSINLITLDVYEKLGLQKKGSI